MLTSCASGSADASKGTVSNETLDEIDLYYTDQGSGDPLVFLPGFTFSSKVFDAQVEAFSKTHRVIVIDPRSHGQSPQTSNGNDYPQHGKDVHRLFERLELSSVTLIGWSFGALSAWSYIEQFGQDRIDRFMCIDMPPVPLSAGEANGDWVELPIDQLPAAYQALSTAEGQSGFLGYYAQNVMVQRTLSPSELDWVVSLSLQTPPNAAQQLFASGCFSNYMSTAKQIDTTIPNMFVLAEHWADVAEPYVREHFPNANVVTMGGHMMFWEYPAAFNEMLSDFLTA